MITAEQVEKLFKKPKNFKSVILRPLKDFYKFSGRSQRAEFFGYLIFFAIAIIISLLSVLVSLISSTLSFAIFGLLTFYSVLLHFSLAVRRLHDINQSGWWSVMCLIPYIGYILYVLLFFIEGTKGNNKYGPDPLKNDQN